MHAAIKSSRPRSVTIAAGVLAAIAGLALLAAIPLLALYFGGGDGIAPAPDTAAVGTTVLVIGLQWAFIVAVWRGRNWARLAYAILYGFHLPFGISMLIGLFQEHRLYAGLMLLGVVAQGAAIASFFVGDAKHWFTAVK